MSGLIGKKIGMTSIYDASGKVVPCTVLEAGSKPSRRTATALSNWLTTRRKRKKRRRL